VPEQKKRKTRGTPSQRRLGGEAEIVATNVRAYRRVRDLSQKQLAAKMTALGYDWSDGIVGFIERGDRNLAVDELLALALVLGVSLPSILDPTGIDGTGTRRLDVGTADPMPAEVARAWLRGDVGLVVDDANYYTMHPVPGRKDEYDETVPAFRGWTRARPPEAAPAPPRRDIDHKKSRRERLDEMARARDEEQE